MLDYCLISRGLRGKQPIDPAGPNASRSLQTVQPLIRIFPTSRSAPLVATAPTTALMHILVSKGVVSIEDIANAFDPLKVLFADNPNSGSGPTAREPSSGSWRNVRLERAAQGSPKDERPFAARQTILSRRKP